jgi:hypothetical protein
MPAHFQHSVQRAVPSAHLVRLAGFAGLLALLSCHLPSTGEPVPVLGTEGERRLLSGNWNGRYWSEATGRHGTIKFSLGERADTGLGEVEMTFSPALRLARDAASVTASGRPTDAPAPSPSTTMDISVVKIELERVRGTMAPYWDPDCNCRARTVFEGTVSGDTITGTFTSRRESSDRRPLTGKWRVEREHS